MASKHEPLPARIQESAMDYAEHQTTYDRFVAGVQYFVICMALLMVGLYFAVIADQQGVGLTFIVASVVVPGVMAMLARK